MRQCGQGSAPCRYNNTRSPTRHPGAPWPLAQRCRPRVVASSGTRANSYGLWSSASKPSLTHRDSESTSASSLHELIRIMNHNHHLHNPMKWSSFSSLTNLASKLRGCHHMLSITACHRTFMVSLSVGRETIIHVEGYQRCGDYARSLLFGKNVMLWFDLGLEHAHGTGSPLTPLTSEGGQKCIFRAQKHTNPYTSTTPRRRRQREAHRTPKITSSKTA